MAKRCTFDLLSKLHLKSLHRGRACTSADTVTDLLFFSAVTSKIKKGVRKGEEPSQRGSPVK